MSTAVGRRYGDANGVRIPVVAIFLFAPLALIACTPTLRSGAHLAASTADAVGVPVPATTTRTTIDEKAVTLAAKAVDAAALSASALVKAGAIKAGSPTALKLANAIDGARDAVNAAQLARQAGNATSYAQALTRAEAAMDAAKAAIATIGG